MDFDTNSKFSSCPGLRIESRGMLFQPAISFDLRSKRLAIDHRLSPLRTI